jgi:hypothetical protein
MATTFDSKNLFVNCGQKLKGYRIDNTRHTQEYQFDVAIRSLVTTYDSKHAFIGLADRHLKQICINSKRVIKDFGPIHEDAIFAMAVTRDNNFLVTSLSEHEQLN